MSPMCLLQRRYTSTILVFLVELYYRQKTSVIIASCTSPKCEGR